MADVMAAESDADFRPDTGTDWAEVARLVLTSRAMDELEETRLVPEKKVLYQFSARGHDMAQVILGLHLRDGDAACGYYRSRPMLLALGVPLADALGSGMGREGGYSDGRDIGVVFNYPNPGGAHALPMCGGVGAQYTPAAGWAQAIAYKSAVLGERDDGAIAVVLGGDASCATGGFWSALTIATTQSLPMLFYIEDNGYGISVPSDYQTPGRDIAANLASFKNLAIWNGDGTDPACADSERARPHPPDRASARRPQLPGYANLQVGRNGQVGMGARPAAQVEDVRNGARLGPDRSVGRAGSRISAG
jgi:2-oxoisovalerate dehydrogenase E1 component